MAKKRAVVKLIFLVGMPAVGKTHWGNKIATTYKIPFVDLDVYIAQQEKASIPALFAMYGENGFREREQKYLGKLVNSTTTTTIFACGGGTPCFADNLELMKKAGTVVYLQSEIALLLNNIKNSDEKRPLLNNRGDLSVYLQDMLVKRKKFYEQAHYILSVKDVSVSDFAKIVAHV